MKEINERISGWYPELKIRIEKMADCGIKVSYMS